MMKTLATLCISLVLLSTVTVNAQTSGTVYRDFNSNGQKETFEIGVEGINISAVDEAGNTASATTDFNGNYSLSIANCTGEVRISFDLASYNDNGNMYDDVYCTTVGPNAITETSFVPCGSTDINLGVNTPTDFCQDVPQVVVPCYINGDPMADCTGLEDMLCAAQRDVLVGFSYDASGNITGTGNPAENLNQTMDHLAMGEDVGSVWGVAYQRETQTLFVSSFNRRHMGFGPLGSGGIYALDYSTTPPATGAPTTDLIDLNSCAGISTGDDPHSGLPADVTLPNMDSLAKVMVGKMGFGDMDITEDGEYLWVTNLHDRTLHKIFIGNTPNNNVNTNVTCDDITTYDIPSPCNDDLDFRPWAVGVRNGLIYIGVLCTNESGNGQFDATVYEFDETANTWTTEINFPLDYDKGVAHSLFGDEWNPWVESSFPSSAFIGNNIIFPQPLFADIDFDADGSMLLSFGDRTSMQTGVANFDDDPQVYTNFAGGDLLRAQINDARDGWVLEQNGQFPGVSNAPTGCGVDNGEGPGGGEFYCGDAWEQNALHEEGHIGGIAVLKGSGEVIGSMYDPTNETGAGGVQKFQADGSNDLNSNIDDFTVYTAQDIGTFGKSAGIGDVELICDAPPIEIGNYVWIDANNNGVQDPGEAGIPNLTINLFDRGTGNFITSTTTDATGQYYFNDGNVALGLMPNTDYVIGIDASHFSGGMLDIGDGEMYMVTAKDNGGANGDGIDSDAMSDGSSGVLAVDVDNLPYIEATTGLYGENNHTFDFGFKIQDCPAVTLVSDVDPNSPLCAPASVVLTATAMPAGVTTTFTFFKDGTEVQSGADNTYTTTESGSYTVSAISDGCDETSNAVTITINATPTPSITPNGDQTICEGGSLTLTADGTYDSYQWLNNGNEIAGATSSTLEVTAAGTYSVRVTDNGCDGTSTDEVTVTIAADLTPTISADGGTTICSGSCTTLTVNGGPYTSVEWFRNGASVGTGNSYDACEAGDYTVAVEDAAGCSGTSAPTTISEATDLIPTISADGGTTICSGSCTTLTVNGGPFTSVEWFRNGVSVGTGNSYDACEAGDYTVAVEDAAGCSGTSASPTTISEAADLTPTISADGGTTICSGSCTTLTVNGGPYTSVEWFRNGASVGTGNSYDACEAGDYTVSVEDAAGCSGTSASPTTISEAADLTPTIQSANGENSICANECLTLQVTGTYTSVEWFRDGSSVGSGNSYEACTAGSYTVSVEDANGCSGTSVPFVVSQSPDISISLDADPATTVCEGEGTITLTASPAGLGTYTFTRNGLTVVQEGASNTYTPDVSGTYTVSVTTDSGCTGASTGVDITIGEAPTLDAGDDASICLGESTSLSIITNGSISNITASPADASLSCTDCNNPTVSPSQNTTYTVTAVSTDGCETTDQVEVMVDDNPSPVIDTNGPTTVCADDAPVVLSVSGSFETYSWYRGTTLVGSGETFEATTSGEYSVEVANGDNCSGTSDAITVTIYEEPTVQLSVAGDGSFCEGASITLAASTGFVNYEWYNNNDLISSGASNELVVSEMGMYYVVITSDDGCDAQSNSVLISENQTPNPTVMLSGEPVFCEGGSVILSLAGTFNSVQWQIDTGSGFSDIPGGTGIVYEASLTGRYRAMVSDGADCEGVSTEVDVEMLEDLNLQLLGVPATVCRENLPVTLTATEYADATYTFILNGGEVVQQSASNTFEASTPGNYTVEVVTADGCADRSASGLLAIQEPPTLGLENMVNVCKRESLHIDVFTNAVELEVRVIDGDLTSIVGNVSTNGFMVEPGSNTIYQVTVISAEGCEETDNITVNVVDPAIIDVAVDNDEVCEGDAATLTATPAGLDRYEWINENDIILQSGATNTFQATESGTYRVMAFDENGCSSISVGKLITVHPNPMPEITVTGNGTFCEGGDLLISASLGYNTYSWYRNDELLSTSASNEYLATEGGTYYVIARDTETGCEGQSQAVELDVNPLPMPHIMPIGDNPICEGESLPLTIAGNYTDIRWEIDRGFGFERIPSSMTTVWNATEAGIYRAFVTDGAACEGTSDEFEVIVYDAVAVSINPDATDICEDDAPTRLVATEGYAQYIWYRNGFTVVQDGVSNVYQASQSGDYAVEAVSSDGCSTLSEGVRINVFKEPVLDAGANIPVCLGESATLSINTDGVIVAITADPADNTISCTDCNNPTVTPTETTTYTITSRTSDGCEATDQMMVVVTNPPNPIIIPENDLLLCEDELPVPMSVTSTWDSYEWKKDGVTVGTGATFEATVSGSYTVVVQRAGGCPGESSKPLVIEVYETPSPEIIPSGDGTFCEGESNTLTATPGYDQYEWYLDRLLIAGPSSSNTYDATAPGAYTVVAISENGCREESDKLRIMENENPMPEVMVIGDTEVCAGDCARLVIMGTYLEVKWFEGNPSNPDAATTIGAGPSIDVCESGTYFAYVTDGEECEGYSTSINITVKDPVDISISGVPNDAVFCESDAPITLTATEYDGATYTWYRSGIIPMQSGSSNTFDVTRTGDYNVVVETADGCEGVSDGVGVIIEDDPFVDFGDDRTICAGEEAILDINSDAQIINIEIVSGDTGDAISCLCTNPTVSPEVTTVYRVTVESEDGCQSTDEVEVDVYEEPPLTINPQEGIICQGGEGTLSVEPTFYENYDWYNDKGILVQSGTSSVLYNKESGLYTVIATDRNGCTVEAVSAIQIQPIPFVEIQVDGSESDCLSAKATISATAGYSSYTWFLNNVPIATTNENSFVVDQEGLYSVEITNSVGCKNLSEVVFVALEDLDQPIPGIDAAGDIALCEGDDARTLCVTDNWVSYAWKAEGSSTVLSSERCFTPTTSGTYYAEVSNDDGCTGSTPQVRVTFNPSPSIVGGGIGDAEGCSGEIVNISVSLSENIQNYSFANQAGITNVSINGVTMTFDLNISGPNTYLLTLTGVSGCSTSETFRSIIPDRCILGSIGDFVWLDTDGDGIQDPGEQGIAGVPVTITYPDGTTETVFTNEDGFYLFDDLPQGNYIVTVGDGPDGTELSTTGTYNVSLSPGEDFLNADFGFSPEPMGRIGDYVWHDDNRDTNQDEPNAGLGGIRVVLTKPDGSTQVTFTDDSGFYLFTGLEGGNYTVTVDASTAPEGFELTTAGVVNVVLPEGGEYLDADFGFDDFRDPQETCTADAGGLKSEGVAKVCANSDAINARVTDQPVVPAGYQVVYVLTKGSALVIEGVSTTPSFNNLPVGVYTIHTLVYNPATLDLSTVNIGVTTGFEVNSLLEQGGGDICAALLLSGAQFSVIECQNNCSTTVDDICTKPLTPVRICPDFPCLKDGYSITNAESTYSCGIKIEQECITYVGLPAFVGNEEILVVACDYSRCDTAVVKITVAEDCSNPTPNTPPVATPDVGTSVNGNTVTINLLGNDYDPDGDNIFVTNVSEPVNGTITIANGIVMYTPNPGFQGQEILTYTVCDGQDCTQSTVTINVIRDCSSTTYMCTQPVTPLIICPDFCDLNMNDVITIESAHTTYNCSLRDLGDGCIQYTALPLFAGKETITIRGCNMNGQCDEVEVIVDVTDNCNTDDDRMESKSEEVILPEFVQTNNPLSITSIAPVPTSDIVNVTVESEQGQVQLQVFDLTGKLMMSRNVDLTDGTTMIRIDMNDYPAGVYSLSLSSANELVNSKIIKQ